MDKDINCRNCGLHLSLLEDRCTGCNTETGFGVRPRGEITTLWMAGTYALLLLVVGVTRMSLP